MRKPMVLIGFNEKCKEIMEHMQELDAENIKLEKICDVRKTRINILEAVNEKLKTENEELKSKYGYQLGLYELMHKIYKLENDNKSLRGTCKALGEKNNNQRKELIRLNNVIDKLKKDKDELKTKLNEAYIELNETYVELQEANDSVTWWINRWNSVDKRLRHLLASDVIKSYDEVNHRTGKYKRNINDLDRALMNKEEK